MTDALTTTDPRTGETHDTALVATSDAAVGAAAAAAAKSFAALRWTGRAWRAGLLEALADALEAARDELVAVADRETGLGAARLTGEVGRSAFQFRLFAEALRDGGYLEATIDHAGETPIGPGPDLRRMLIPIGPVAVFGSSNFPFAFSVAGGDVASALAAGNPVIIKAHGSHLETSAATFVTLSAAATGYGAPSATLGIVYGTQAGRALVADPQVRAVGFTGSLDGGRALLSIIESRPDPIPFYGELSSLNPLVVTPAAARDRGDAVAEGLFGSFTLGSGQFCTKPGLAFVPAGDAGDAIVRQLADRARAAEPGVLLNERIGTSFGEIRERLVERGRARVVAMGSGERAQGFHATPTVLELDAAAVTPDVTEEAFGPLIVVARYATTADVFTALDAVPDSLTATIHAQPDESALIDELVRELVPRAGRVVFNGYPTGVRVAWAQHHGGSWPSTNSQHTSVGVSAIRRFLRPVAYQDAPAHALPVELRDGASDVPRRIDGVLTLPTA
ncbi:aldehyde dehydrogenase (NADP(+)) [Microbacterium sp. 2FI]|uniref:aldehyde dehydrogenase (NADP(+)) n=1 Tax=Microbacterium sp. 2FI TaxID=2502193 RepID=UPI0010F444B9|nr:aldehyde dehydrogenase (NADP(+)) [Microbacterium sp. 2FI]